MKLLANENIPIATVRALRIDGHDVLSISETAPGISDTEVLTIAKAERRVLITFDRDYGALVYVRRLPCPPALVYLRFVPATPDEAAKCLARLLAESPSVVEGRFIVLERDGYRCRPLPA